MLQQTLLLVSCLVKLEISNRYSKECGMEPKYKIGDRVCLVRYENTVIDCLFTESNNRKVDKFKDSVCTIDFVCKFDTCTPLYQLHTDNGDTLGLSEEFLIPYNDDDDDIVEDLKSLFDVTG